MHRVTFEVPDKVRERLERCQSLSESGTLTGTVRAALQMYEVLLNHMDAGGKIIIEDADGKQREVILL